MERYVPSLSTDLEQLEKPAEKPKEPEKEPIKEPVKPPKKKTSKLKLPNWFTEFIDNATNDEEDQVTDRD